MKYRKRVPEYEVFHWFEGADAANLAANVRALGLPAEHHKYDTFEEIVVADQSASPGEYIVVDPELNVNVWPDYAFLARFEEVPDEDVG